MSTVPIEQALTYINESQSIQQQQDQQQQDQLSIDGLAIDGQNNDNNGNGFEGLTDPSASSQDLQNLHNPHGDLLKGIKA